VREGTWCVPRVWNNGLPRELARFTRFAKFLFHQLPSSVVCGYFQRAANARFDHALYGLQPSHVITASRLVINDSLPSRIISGTVQVRPGIDRLTSSGVQFTDGTYVDDIAAVICATGKYRLRCCPQVTDILPTFNMRKDANCSYEKTVIRCSA